MFSTTREKVIDGIWLRPTAPNNTKKQRLHLELMVVFDIKVHIPLANITHQHLQNDTEWENWEYWVYGLRQIPSCTDTHLDLAE